MWPCRKKESPVGSGEPGYYLELIPGGGAYIVDRNYDVVATYWPIHPNAEAAARIHCAELVRLFRNGWGGEYR